MRKIYQIKFQERKKGMNTTPQKKSNGFISVICIFIAVLMLISVLPAFVLCFYTFPSPGDDYYNSVLTFQEWEQTQSLSIVKVAFDHAVERYMNWQGTLSACFLFALNPMIFSISIYRIVMFLLNLLFVASIYIFCSAFLRKFYDVKKYVSFFVGTSIVFAFYHCVPYANLFEISYWYTGSVCYLLTFSLTLIFASWTLKHFRKRAENKRNIVGLILILLLCVYIGLNNLANALMIWSAGVVVLAVAFIKKYPYKKALILIFSVLTAALVVNIAAPGNFVRLEHEQLKEISEASVAGGFIESITQSFKTGTHDLKGFILISPVAGLLLLLSPIFLSKGLEQRKHINPILLIVASYLIFIAQYVPFLYSLGDLEFGRTQAMRFISVQILLVINYINFMNFISSKRMASVVRRIIGIAALAAGILMVYHASMVRIIPHSHIRTMYEEYKSGKIETFISERNERIRILEDESIENAIFEPMTYKDVCFGFDYTSESEKALMNRGLAEYYDKESVAVSPGE